MKKILLSLLLVLAIFTLTACDGDSDDQDGLRKESYQETIQTLV